MISIPAYGIADRFLSYYMAGKQSCQRPDWPCPLPIQATLAGISSQLGSCCCDIKSTLLQNRYEDVVRENARLLADKSNADQSAYLLSVMGKWVANPAAVA